MFRWDCLSFTASLNRVSLLSHLLFVLRFFEFRRTFSMISLLIFDDIRDWQRMRSFQWRLHVIIDCELRVEKIINSVALRVFYISSKIILHYFVDVHDLFISLELMSWWELDTNVVSSADSFSEFDNQLSVAIVYYDCRKFICENTLRYIAFISSSIKSDIIDSYSRLLISRSTIIRMWQYVRSGRVQSKRNSTKFNDRSSHFLWDINRKTNSSCFWVL